MNKLLKRFKDSIAKTNRETKTTVEENDDALMRGNGTTSTKKKAPKRKRGGRGGDSDSDDGDKRVDFDQNFSGDEGLVSGDENKGADSDDIGLDDDDDDKDLFAAQLSDPDEPGKTDKKRGNIASMVTAKLNETEQVKEDENAMAAVDKESDSESYDSEFAADIGDEVGTKRSHKQVKGSSIRNEQPSKRRNY